MSSTTTNQVEALAQGRHENPLGFLGPGLFDIFVQTKPKPQLDVSGEVKIDLRGDLQTAWGGFGGRGVVEGYPLSGFGGLRYVKDLSLQIFGQANARITEKWGAEFLSTYDFQFGQNLFRIVFRRYSPDHVIEFGVNIRDGNVELQFSLEPAVGGVGTESSGLFRNQATPDIEGGFGR